MDDLMVAVGREVGSRERRVALVPDDVRRLCAAGLLVRVAAGAGAGAWFDDDGYARAGAEVVPPSGLVAADVVVSVGRPPDALVDGLRAGTAVVGLLAPLADPRYVARLAGRGLTAVSLDCLPRTLSRAQPMDALTSQASVAGYKAVLVAADVFDRYFPLLVTAAGTARPARVLVLGAGVAGLQAMGTARRLGAVVAGYDVRPESRAEVESVGATFLDLPALPASSGTGGYAPVLDSDQQRAQQEVLAAHVARHDVVITTAQVPGRRPPLLVDMDAVKAMAPGSVIVDLAAGPLGGNVALSRPGETLVTDHGVTVVGAGDLAARVPTAASVAYSHNVRALLSHLVRDGRLAIDLSDEIQAGVVLTHAGRVVHPAVSRLLESGALR
jgi:NAD(P) transhydrogenase subunit alpha